MSAGGLEQGAVSMASRESPPVLLGWCLPWNPCMVWSKAPRAEVDIPGEANGWRREKCSLSVGFCSILLSERPSLGAGQGGVFGLLVSRFLCGGWGRAWGSEMRGRPPHRCKSSCQEPPLPALSSARS